jgi:hypothetical protein
MVRDRAVLTPTVFLFCICSPDASCGDLPQFTLNRCESEASCSVRKGSPVSMFTRRGPWLPNFAVDLPGKMHQQVVSGMMEPRRTKTALH